VWWGSQIIWAAFRNSPKLSCKCEEIPRRWSRLLLRMAGTSVVVEDEHLIDPDRPQILVANHVSWFDVLVVAGYLPGSYRFIAKKELANVPFFGASWRACGHIAIDRQDINQAKGALALAEKELEKDRPTVILFPEGTRSETGELRRFKKGAFVLAIKSGIEVVPAAILGTRDVMPKGSWRIRTGRTVTLRFGPPLGVDGLTMDDRDALASKGRDAVARLLESGPETMNEHSTNESR
jgi:1-acyl-sn-glycerol-3-phosphate acyltransferase